MTGIEQSASFTKAEEKLKELLDAGTAKPAEYIEILRELAKSSPVHEAGMTLSGPASFAEYTARPIRKLWGMFTDSFFQIGANLEEQDFNDYITCIELIPDNGIVQQMLFVMLDGLLGKDPMVFARNFAPRLPFFLADGKWNNSRPLLLVLKILIETAGTRYDNSVDFISTLLESRDESEKPAILLAVVSLIVFNLDGRLHGDKDGEGSTSRRAGHADILRAFLLSLDPEIKKATKSIDIELISAFFGLDTAGDAKLLTRCKETGEISAAEGRLYAQALIVARLIDAELTQEQWGMLLQRSLLFKDRSVTWEDGGYKTFGLFAGQAISRADNPLCLWDEVLAWWNATIYLSINGDNQARYEARLDAYLASAACAIDDLLYPKDYNNGRMDVETAFHIWKRAWNDCITALYSCFFPNGSFLTAQALFTYAALKFIDRVDIGELADQLPFVELRSHTRIDTRKACLYNLLENCNGKNEPELKHMENDYAEFYDEARKAHNEFAEELMRRDDARLGRERHNRC